jgi:hypothetical protein
MQQQQSIPALAMRIRGNLQTQKGSAAQIYQMPLRSSPILKLRLHRKITPERNLFHWQRRAPIYHLNLLRQTLPQYGGTKNVVTINDALQSCDQVFQSLATTDGQQDRHYVGVAFLAFEHVMEKHSVLQRREGINVLDVFAATRNRVCDSLDMGWCEPNER